MSTSERQHRWDGLERNTRGKTELVWKVDGNIVRRILEYGFDRERGNGEGQKRRSLDVVKEDMADVEVTGL